MKISTRLKLAIFIPAVMALSIIIALVISYQDMAKTQEAGDTVRQVRSGITELNHFVFSYVLYHEERPKQQFLAEHDVLTQLLASARVQTPDQQHLLDSIRGDSVNMKDLFLQLVSNYESTDTAGTEQLQETEDRLVGLLLQRSYEADTDAASLRSLIDEGIRVNEIRTIGLIFLVIVLATIPLTIVLIRTRRVITLSISNLSKGAAVIGSGNLDFKIEEKTNDEIGDLSRTFNQMTSNLKTVTASKIDLEKEIDERKRVESELKNVSAQRQLALDAAGMGWWQYDPVKRYSWWDERYKQIFGFAEYEKPNDEVLATRLHPEDLAGVWAKVEAALDPVNPLPYSAEYRINLPDGSIRWVEAHGTATFEGTGKDKHATSLIGTIIDITERKKAEEALEESEAKANALIKYAPTGIYEIDFRGPRFLSINDAMCVLTGYTREEMFAIGPVAMLDEDSRRVFANRISRQLAGEKIDETVEYKVRKKDGSFIFVILNVAFSKDNPGTALVIGHDVTQRKKAEEELKRSNNELEASNKELEAFSYSVSHDLRAPLRSMEGFSNALLEDYSDKLDDQGKHFLKHVMDSSDLMGHLIDDLLKLSRVTRNEMTYEMVNLSEVARKILTELQKTELDRKVKLDISPDVKAYGDRNLLRLVLENLLGNAWKFSSKTDLPRIEMGVTMHNNKQAYFIRDNGVGFDMAYADKLFKPFQRLHKASEFAGTGIGLATVQRIVRRHGGEVWAESKVGEGATFYFTLN